MRELGVNGGLWLLMCPRMAILYVPIWMGREMGETFGTVKHGDRVPFLQVDWIRTRTDVDRHLQQ